MFVRFWTVLALCCVFAPFVGFAQQTAQEAPGDSPQVVLGPPPEWVVANELTAKARPDGVGLRMMDVQNRVDANGLHTYLHSIARFNSAASLQQATNLLLRWQPAMGNATVHSARVWRNGTAIDLLASARFQTIRQEARLETGMLDGLYTAFMPIADLRVGDEVEFSYTIDRQNPVLGDHIEFTGSLVPGLSVDQLYVRNSWPSDRAMQTHAGDGLPKPKLAQKAGWTSWTISGTDIDVPTVPQDAPGRYAQRTIYQLSDFENWGAVAALMAPLYEKASTLADGSPIQAEIDDILARHETPIARAQAALALVQTDIRYFADVQGLGGYVPMSADTVWERRIGDCKGKTVLLLALLDGLGIAAEPALVSVQGSDGVDMSLPMPGRFDHVLVRATINGKIYWLDGTRFEDGPIATQETPGYLWALPFYAKGEAKLAAIPIDAFQRPENEFHLTLDASAGIDEPAKASGSAVYRNDSAQQLGAMLQLLDDAKREELLKGFWRGRYDSMTIESVSHTIDREKGEVRIAFEGSKEMDWDRTGDDADFRYSADYAVLGSNILADRKADRDADIPVAVGRRYDTVSETIILPDNGKGYSIDGEDIDETIGGISYRRTVTLDGDRFEMQTSIRSPYLEMSHDEALAADEKTDRLFKKRVYVVLPVAQRIAGLGEQPEKLAQHIVEMAGSGNVEEARALLDKSLADNPRSADLLVARAIFESHSDDPEAADRSIDAALAIDPNNIRAVLYKSKLLSQRDRKDHALLLLDRAILLNPGYPDLYLARSALRKLANDKLGALADLDIVLGRDPADATARIEQISLLSSMKRTDDAIAAARAYRDADPDSVTAINLVANTLAVAEKPAEALKYIDEALAIEANADSYIIKLTFGLSDGPEGLVSDILALIEIEPARAIPTKAVDRIVGNKPAMAKIEAAYDAALAQADGNRDAVAYQRAMVLMKGGDSAPLAALLENREAKNPDSAMELNELCWLRAINAIDLDAARKNCAAALEKHRDPAFVDSMAMVELKSGNYAAAIALYDEALEKEPGLADSLYGRGIAKQRLGQDGQPDLEKALEMNRELDKTFEGYGLSL